MKELKIYELRELCELKIEEIVEAEYNEDEEKAEQLSTELDKLLGSFDHKGGNFILYLKNLTRTINAVEEEIKELQGMVKTMKNKKKGGTEFLGKQLRLLGRTKIEYNGHTARFQKSPQAVVVLDESQIPDEYKVIKVSVSKTLIHKNFKETGEILPGTDIVQGEHLRIQ